MTLFWLFAGLLCLIALAFLLIPLLRPRQEQAEVDRTALNVSLYQERLSEIAQLQDAGSLTDEQAQVARNEAARELLADTQEIAAAQPQTRLGRKLPLLAALLVPFCALGLYSHWGAFNELEQARALAGAPQSLEQMTQRLEQAVRSNPQSVQGWYFLGRSYMAEQRAGEAAKAFEQAVGLAGREPELLGQWAQALYFSGDRLWTEQLQALTDEALRSDPNEVTSLGLLGIAAYEDQRYGQAIDYWQRLLALLPEAEPSHQAIVEGIAMARQALSPDTANGVTQAQDGLQVRVELAASLRDKVQPEDSVFVFARALSGPAMPLAVKRLRVADLPAEVSLADSDAMLEQLKLSSFAQVQLVARISRAGNASKGEWIGLGQPLASSERQLQHLIIDSAEGTQP